MTEIVFATVISGIVGVLIGAPWFAGVNNPSAFRWLAGWYYIVIPVAQLGVMVALWAHQEGFQAAAAMTGDPTGLAYSPPLGMGMIQVLLMPMVCGAYLLALVIWDHNVVAPLIDKHRDQQREGQHPEE